MQSSRQTLPAAPRSAWALYRRTLRRRRGKIAGGFGLLMGWNVCEALVPVVIGVVIEEAVTTGDASALVLWCAVLCGLFTVLSLSYRFGSRLGWDAELIETHELRVELAAHILDERGSTTTHLPGELLSIATVDAENTASVIRQAGYALAGVASVLVSAVFLLRADVVVGLVILLGVPVLLLSIQVLSPVISRRATHQQESIGRASGIAVDLVQGLRVLKGIGGEDAALRRYRRASRTARDASIETARSLGHMYGLTGALSGLFLAVVALLAGRLALDGQISIGEFIAVVGITQFIAEPLETIGEVSAQTSVSLASARRIVSVLQTPHLVAVGTTVPPTATGALELRDVHAGALRGVSLRIRPGELVGVVVEDPRTSDDLVALVAGETPLDELRGTVTLDGVALHAMPRDEARARLLVSRHRVDLFEGTLRSNVETLAPLGDERLAAVLAASAADDVVTLREGGVDQRVEATGSSYSGGQRQRIALARALATDAPTLVLQEPTTAVDAVTEQRIAAGLRQLRHAPGSARATVVVTVSPSMLAVADRVVLVRDGRVAAEGTHASLSADPAYQEAVLR